MPEYQAQSRQLLTLGAVVANQTPREHLPLLRMFDRPQPLDFYTIAIFDDDF